MSYKIRAKLVPEATPRANGEWRTFTLPRPVERFAEAVELLAEEIPEGYVVVAYKRHPDQPMVSGG